MAKQSRSTSSADASVFQTVLAPTAYAGALSAYFWYTLKYGTLVADPVKSLWEGIAAVTALQIVYCVFGGLRTVAGSAPGTKSKSAKSTKPALPTSLASDLSTALLATILGFAMSILVFLLLVLFGAPATTYVPETFLCAVHISLLSVQPLVFVYSLDSHVWRDIISVKLPLNGIYGASVGTWLGAWLGAVPIPLDWDRPWQRWPVTIVAGAYIGTVIGTLFGAFYRWIRN